MFSLFRSSANEFIIYWHRKIGKHENSPCPAKEFLLHTVRAIGKLKK